MANPELEHLRAATIRALEIRDEASIIRGLSRGELEARILDGERAQASVAAQRAERQASSDYAVRFERETQAEAETYQQAKARDEAEMEL